jgi:phosphoglycerate-specific signal transduction histidine kinase
LVDYGSLTKFDRLNLLEQENQELSAEIGDMRITLQLNKSSMVDIITATSTNNRDKALITTINRLVQENVSLQDELQKVQDKFIEALRPRPSDVDGCNNPENSPEEHKNYFESARIYAKTPPEISNEKISKDRKSSISHAKINGLVHENKCHA